MSKSVQYITNQERERVGVVLDLETYNHLIHESTADAEILTDLNFDELTTLPESILASKILMSIR